MCRVLMVMPLRCKGHRREGEEERRGKEEGKGGVEVGR